MYHNVIFAPQKKNHNFSPVSQKIFPESRAPRIEGP